MAFFFFGTLMDPDVLARVLDRALVPGELMHARLPGYRRMQARDASYPVLVPGPAAAVDGRLLTTPSRRDERRITWFEEDEYVEHWHSVTLPDTGEQRRARVFLAQDELAAGVDRWDFERWIAREKHDFLRQCEIWMRDCPP